MQADEIRGSIEGIDKQLVQLLNERLELAVQLVALKRENGTTDLTADENETALLNRVCSLNNGPVRDETLHAIFREVMAGAMAVDEPVKVAFLGPASTFTHQASLSRFGAGARYMPQQSISDIFEAVDRDQADYGVVPVENSTEGAVTHTLDMFADSTVSICAEINMAIHHNLLSRSKREEIRVVYSHPQVFGQCRHWLQRNLPDVPLVEVSSTTEAASRCAEEPGSGALAGMLAAERYKLNPLDQNIEDRPDNITRFIVIGKQQVEPTGDDKTSILFVVRDRVGALYDSLLPFRAHDINMTFIESRPSRRKRWQYCFFVDFVGHVSEERVKKTIEELSEHCQFVKIMGSYPKANYTV